MKRLLAYLLLAGATLPGMSCIDNDLPYPTVEVAINNVQGEGFTLEGVDAATRTVTLALDEATDIQNVHIEEVTYSVTPHNTNIDQQTFLDNIRPSREVTGTFDLRTPLYVTLTLYEDYDWQIVASQTIPLSFQVEGQIGAPEFDLDNRIARAYVAKDADRSRVTISELKLGPKEITTMTPSPEELTVFETFRQVYIQYHDFKETWRLYVIPTDITIQFTQTDAWSRVIWLYAAGKSGTSLGFRYRKSGDTEWTDVPADKITVDGGSLSTCISGLEPETTYEVIAFSDSNETEIISLKTDPETSLTNGGFEEWCTEKDIVYPGPSKEGSYWGTGNPGASIGGVTLTSSTTDKRPGSSGSYAAHLQSKLAGVAGIGKLAAGNLFIGQYVGTRGTNGIVGFGRPYTLRPTALKGWIKYNRGNITDVGTIQPPGVTIAKGDPDMGTVYIALGTWTPEEYGVCEKEDGNKQVGTDEVPICIDTRDPNTFFNPKSPAVIAYGEMLLTESIANWQQFTIKLDYNTTHTVPTHLVIVCSASRYGDYYIGSRDSEMWLDDFELVYDYEE